nr:DUF551 domain-containing protein [Klebsiella quasipneumoniae]
MTKSTITRERAQQIFLGNGPEPSASEERELARMALAAMDSEPVAWMHNNNNIGIPAITTSQKIGKYWMSEFKDVQPLYRHAHPAPVVPNGLRLALSNAGIAAPESDEMLAATCEKHIQALVTWVRDRKPFQSAPVVMDDRKLRSLFDSWFASDCSFDLSPEASEEDNIAWRESYWYVWQRCRAAMLQAGNSPVIPDGYVMVPKEMTDEIGEAIAMKANCCGGIALDIYDAMLAAAPHDIPALNSLQSVDSVADRWIPVSERLPEDRTQVILWDAEIGEVTSGHYSNKTHTFYHCGDAIENEITHWMAPPAAPQEVRGE